MSSEQEELKNSAWEESQTLKSSWWESHFPSYISLYQQSSLWLLSSTVWWVEHCGLNTHLSVWFLRGGSTLQCHTAVTSYTNSYLLSQQTCSITSCLQAQCCRLREPWFALALLRHVLKNSMFSQGTLKNRLIVKWIWIESYQRGRRVSSEIL